MHLQVLGRLDQKNILPWIHIPLQSPNIQWLHSSSKHSWWCEEAPSWLFLHPFILIFMHSWGANNFFIVPAPQNLPTAFIPRWVSCTDEPYWWAPSCSIQWTCTGHCYMKIMLPSPKNLHQCTGTALFITDKIPLAKVWSLTYHWKSKPILYSPYKIHCHQFYHDPNFQRMYTPALNF